MDAKDLIIGDAARVMAGLPCNSVELLIADPPYNLGKDYGNNQDMLDWQGYEKFTRQWLAAAVPLLRPSGSLYVFMGVQFIARLFLMMQAEFGLHFNGWITWHYTQGMGRKTGFSPRHEDILYFTRSHDYTFNLEAVRIPQKYYRQRNNMAGANPGDVWHFSHVHYSNPEREQHPTQKPEALLARIIQASSNPGELVLDPFVGSGTTCRVAQALGRRYLGIDINPEYIAMSQRRLEAPFASFDSIDPRAGRIPQNLPQLAKERHDE
jgi:DNA modification methylase